MFFFGKPRHERFSVTHKTLRISATARRHTSQCRIELGSQTPTRVSLPPRRVGGAAGGHECCECCPLQSGASNKDTRTLQGSTTRLTAKTASFRSPDACGQTVVETDDELRPFGCPTRRFYRDSRVLHRGLRCYTRRTRKLHVTSSSIKSTKKRCSLLSHILSLETVSKGEGKGSPYITRVLKV